MFGINAKSADIIHDDGTGRNSSIRLVNLAERNVRRILKVKIMG